MVKRHDKAEDGMYHIKGKVFAELKGSRAKVFNGTAYKTEGGLVKADLIKNKWNRIVSKKKSITAKSIWHLHICCRRKRKITFTTRILGN